MTAPTTIGMADRSLVAQIHEHLRTQIIEGELEPGSRLGEQALANALHVSRVPLREAIPLLEAEGFVVTTPRRGTFVVRLTLADVDDLFDLRESLEVLAARRAAERIAEIDVDTLTTVRSVLAANREAVLAADDRNIAATSAEFHRLVVQMSGNTLLRTMMRPVDGRVEWLFRLTASRDQMVACQEHDQLLRAILGGDGEKAARIAFDHIASGREPSLKILAQVIPAS